MVSVSYRGVVIYVCLPLLIAVFVSWRRSEDIEWEDVASESFESPALELLQREAKIVQASKKIWANKARDLGETTKTTTASAFGIGANGIGNLPTFLTGLVTDFCVIAACICLFQVWSHKYPILFGKGNIDSTMAPSIIQGQVVDAENMTVFGWARASWKLDLETVWDAAGLDKAMLLYFVELCVKAMLWIAIPMFWITGPLNCFFGGNAAGEDHESWFSLGNVRFYSWLYWVTGFACCYVGYIVCNMCHEGMRTFMPIRKRWLLSLNDTRSRTLLMVGIPKKQRNEQVCKDFWNVLLPGKVEKVYLTKDTSEKLLGLVQLRERARVDLDAAITDLNSVDMAAADSGSQRRLYQTKKESLESQVSDLEKQVNVERERILGKSLAQNVDDDNNLNLGTGFITFKDRLSAEIALQMRLGDDVHTWVMDSAPEPVDIIWGDLTENETAGGARTLLGYALTLGVMIIYMPLVVAIANIAEAINLGPFQSIWSSEAPSIGLTIMVDFLPTILVLIFTNCFSVYDKSNQQYKLTCWYYWMNILFVVLVTALGTSFMSFVRTLANDPLKVFHLFATTMPNCTHYYMNYLGMQWYSMAMQLTRYMNVIKYMAFSRHHDEVNARELSEPEDQDYYGIGSRTARFSTLMTIAIVYGTLSPPCSVLGLLTMLWIRTLFGYIFVWNETRKPDLGGIFFHRALVNMYIALHIYFILMCGVLYIRGNDSGPALIAACGWVYVFYSQNKFYQYNWEHIQVTELVSKEERQLQNRYTAVLHGRYIQPEMYDEDVVNSTKALRGNADRLKDWSKAAQEGRLIQQPSWLSK